MQKHVIAVFNMDRFTVQVKHDADGLVVIPKGILDANSVSEFDAIVTKELKGCTNLTFDLGNLTYISSVGLRIFLKATKAVKGNGGSVKSVNGDDDINEIFQVTGFDGIVGLQKNND